MWFEDHHGGIMEGTYVRSNATLRTDNDYWKVRSSTTEKYEHRQQARIEGMRINV